MTIHYASPSYRRPNDVLSYAYFPQATYYVDDSDFRQYRKANRGMKLHRLPDGVQGNVSRVRNYILAKCRSMVLVMFDDDIVKLGYWENNEEHIFGSPEEIQEFILKYTQLAIGLSIRLWGMNLNTDKQLYREYTPFSFKAPVLGPFNVHIGPFDIRYDERIPLKEDYDHFIQYMNADRRVLRVNKAFYGNRRSDMPGGCTESRNINEERRQLALLQRKWGVDVVRYGGNTQSHRAKKVNKFDVNPIIRIPIGGV